MKTRHFGVKAVRLATVLATMALIVLGPGVSSAYAAVNAAAIQENSQGNPELVSVRDNVGRLPLLERKVSLDLRDVSLETALKTIAEKAKLKLSYASEVLPTEPVRVTLRAQEITAGEAFERVLHGTGLDLLISPDGLAALVRRPESSNGSEPPQEPVGSVTGRVTNAATGAGISGVTVTVEGTRFGAVAGNTGRYRIADVPAGRYTVATQQLGYAEAEKSVTVTDGGIATADFALEVSALPLDEVVATGTAFETRVRTLPNPISVITGREIEQKQASNVAELLRGAIPGVVALSNGQNDYHSRIYVRGNASWTSEDYIKIYIDGVEVASPAYLSTIDPTSIERLEVVRGPQASVIYGSEASSGVLQIFTKKGRPGLDRPQLDVQASVGTIESDYVPSDGGRPLTQDHSLQVSGGTEAFSYRAGASYGTVGEWLAGYGSETLSFSGGLGAVQGPLTAELSALWSDRDMNSASSPIYWNYPASSSCPYCGQPDLVYPNRDIALSQNTMGLTLSYRVTPQWQHTLILGDDQNRYAYHQPEPAYLIPADTFVELYNNETRRRSVRYHTAYEADLANSVTGRFTVGADYWSYDVQGSSVSNLLDAFGTVQTSDSTSTSFRNDRWWNAGYFGMAELGLRDQFFLTLAARIEDNPHLGEEYGRAVSPRIGASFVRKLGPAEVKLRGQYGKGLRAPPGYARVGQVISSAVYLSNPEIGPEERLGWDGGVDFYWDQGSLSLTRYEEEGKNLIQAVDLDLTVTPTIHQYQNIGRVGSEGWEVEGRVDAGPMTVEVNYAYSENVIRELSAQYTSNPNSQLQVGDRMSYIPVHSGGGTVRARFWRGSASVNMSVMDEWRATDYIAYYGSAYGGEPYRGSFRDYYVTYSDALWKWNLRAEQAMTERLTAFLRLDNLANNQAADLYNYNVTPGRTMAMGVRLTY